MEKVLPEISGSWLYISPAPVRKRKKKTERLNIPAAVLFSVLNIHIYSFRWKMQIRDQGN
jgi:hypothetical protein